jgi:hypothetical protein
MTIQDKREELRQRVEASRGRFSPDPVEEREPIISDRLGELARRYPLILVGGAVFIGMILGLSSSRGSKSSKRLAKIDKSVSSFLVDLLFAVGISLLKDISSSAVFDEDDEDEARASSASKKNELIRGAAGMAADASEKLRESQKAAGTAE